ncbi:MAG: glycosyltransferase family 4 protein [Pseudomonadota bacterium]
MSELFVTNLNRRFTGVSATVNGLLPEQSKTLALRLVGIPLPAVPETISLGAARKMSRQPPAKRPFAIWHVRRDPEMRAAIWARDVLRLPIRTVFTSAARHRHGAIPRWLIGRQDAVIATSEEAAHFFDAVAAIAPHGVDTAAFSPALNRAAAWAALGYGGTEGIATLGRIRETKGTDIFVDAMIRVCQARPGAVGLVLGEAKGADQAFLERLKLRVAEAGLCQRILFLGFVDDERKRAVLQAISLVANLPRYEPFGVVPIEGMASGTPFVCSDSGHYAQFSDRGRTGVIVPREEPEAAATEIIALLQDGERHARLCSHGLDLAIS